MRIGAHVSVAGGLHQAVGNARAVGCESLQVFVSNACGWAPPPVDPAGDERFRADLADARLGPLFVHAPYLVNLSASPVTRERSSQAWSPPPWPRRPASAPPGRSSTPARPWPPAGPPAWPSPGRRCSPWPTPPAPTSSWS